jgi:hypothetical protein
MGKEMTPGRAIVEGLSGLLKTLRDGAKPEERYRSATVRRITNPKTGEEIITRISTDPKEQK